MKRTLALAFALLASPLAAHEYKIADLVIDHPFAASSAKGVKAGAGYMEITNTGDTVDRLVMVKADFPMVQIHASVEEDGVARMIHLDNGVELLPGETVALAPGGLHVMFMGLTDPLVAGEKVEATLVFEQAGEVDVVFNIEDRADIMDMHSGHDHSGHGS